MADPLSVAGLAAGLMSLGLQSYAGISEYIESLDCREQDIASVRQQNDCLRKTLQVIETPLTQLRCDHQEATAAVRDCLDSCKRELQALNALVAELAGRSQPITGWENKIKNQGKKLLYPFSRQKLTQLDTRLRNANSTLQLTLQALVLSVSQRSAEKLATLESTFQSGYTNLGVDIESKLSALATPLQSIRSTQELGLRTLLGLRTRVESFEHLVTQLAAPGPGINESWPKVTSEEVARRLLGKPAVLKEVCDTVGVRARPAPSAVLPATNRSAPQPGDILPSVGGTFLCSCRSRRLRRRKNVTWGPLTLFLETAARQHLPGCPALQVPSTDWARKVGLRYTGLRPLLNLAVKLSFTMTSNAGGCSIGPNVTYYPTVSGTSPAFQIISLLTQAYFSCSYNHCEVQSQQAKLVEFAGSTILKLFRTGRASPRAVDGDNESLIHCLASCMRIEHHTWSQDGPTAAALRELLKILVDCKVPVNDHDISGKSPVNNLFEYDYHNPDESGVLVAAADVILQPDEITLACLSEPSVQSTVLRDPYSGSATVYTVGRVLRFLSSSIKIAEAYGCGPLGLAILANNRDEVEYLLRRHPGTLNERTIFGHSPLHLAADKAACLRLLVQAADSTLLNETDCCNMSALEVALTISGSRCRERTNGYQCRHCACVECAVILLEADCAVPVSSSLQTLLNGASKRSKLIYICHIRDRRQRLKQLALGHLSAMDTDRLGLPGPGVLDSLAPEVFQLLQQRGIKIPDALSIHRAGTPLIASVYQALEDPRDAHLFFQLGFLDTASALDLVEGNGSPGLMGEQLFMHWLAKHGVDAVHAKLKSFELGRGIFTAHYTFWNIARHFPPTLCRRPNMNHWFPATQRAWIRDINAAVLAGNITDNCRCRCSPGGCTPVTYLLKGFLHPLRTGHWLTVEYASLHFSRYLTLFGDDLDLKHHTAALRYFTFTVMGLPHTCCEPSLALTGTDTVWSGNDVDEIEGEHAYGLGLLEDLLDEFERDVIAILQGPDSPITGLLAFWKYTWPIRMTEIQNSLNGSKLEDGEKRGAEEVGVVWDEPAVEVTRNPYDKSTVDYWMYELKEIAEGC